MNSLHTPGSECSGDTEYGPVIITDPLNTLENKIDRMLEENNYNTAMLSILSQKIVSKQKLHDRIDSVIADQNTQKNNIKRMLEEQKSNITRMLEEQKSNITRMLEEQKSNITRMLEEQKSNIANSCPRAVIKSEIPLLSGIQNCTTSQYYVSQLVNVPGERTLIICVRSYLMNHPVTNGHMYASVMLYQENGHKVSKWINHFTCYANIFDTFIHVPWSGSLPPVLHISITGVMCDGSYPGQGNVNKIDVSLVSG